MTPIFNKKFLFIIICLFAGAVSLPAQEESPWYEEFFIEGSALLYFTPSLLKDYTKPGFGFRGALGYEYKRFRLAVESGYSRVAGTDSLVSQIGFTPLVLKFGYNLPLSSIFDLPSNLPIGLQADINAGAVFSKIMRYPTEIDLAMDNVQEDRESSFIAGGRLYGTVTPLPYLRVYAGGGIDLIFEKEGPLPLPLVEIGVHFKPFVLAGSKPEPQPQPQTETEAETTGLVYDSIYFEANSIYIKADSVPKLDETGRLLQDNPRQKIVLRAYYAPDGREKQVSRRNGDPALSAARAEWCARYLLENYGIEADRVKIEHRNAGSRDELYRCIEIIL